MRKIVLLMSCCNLKAQIIDVPVFWWDYGYKSGTYDVSYTEKLSMPPSGNGREQNWHSTWHGFPDMKFSPSACTYETQVLAVTCSAGCTGAAVCHADFTCPDGTVAVGTGKCKLKYNVVVPPTNPPPQCSLGNPIEVGTGSKFQKEQDWAGLGQGLIGFDRYYSYRNFSSGIFWKHTYEKNLTIIDPTTTLENTKKSSDYLTPEDACISGWPEIKSTVTNSWATGTTAHYNNGLCQLMRNNVVVRSIPIVPTAAISDDIIPGAIQLHRPDGSTLEFQYVAPATYTTLSADQGALSRVNTSEAMWMYSTPDGDIELYSRTGALLSITSKNGLKTSLSYDPASGLLSKVEDSFSRKLTFSYINNSLVSMSADTNNVTTYTYNFQGMLSDVKRPNNTHRLYHYEDSRFPAALTGITDEGGVRFATWTYDDQGRAISSEHASGAEKVELLFNADGSTTATNALGKKTIYRFSEIAGARRVAVVEGQPTASCLGANKNYTYTTEGWLASKTDWNGNKTTYQYNAKGQEISHTEAYGSSTAKTISTEWHPTFNLKTKITEPGRETTYTYDGNGLLTNQNARPLP